ncbi:hypothetical protein M0R45_029729 [Rubus argutus]|uniref:Uncharacterized protein n=1 Tax=Rubus argutus TaxID=59490 RepID=A0AAW1WCI2_RUBAR
MKLVINVAFQPQNNHSCFMEEAKEVYELDEESNCNSIVTKEDFRDDTVKEVEAEKKLDVHEANSRPKEGFEQLVREADVHEEQIL